MTPDQEANREIVRKIEQQVECQIDNLDHRYLNSSMTLTEYEKQMNSICKWGEREYLLLINGAYDDC